MNTFNSSTTGKVNLLLSRGYRLQLGLYFEQAMNTVKQNAGLFFAFTAIYFAFLFGLYNLKEFGTVVQLFVAGPVTGGYYIVVHRIWSGLPYRFENFLDGFRIYLPLLSAGMLVNLLVSLGAVFYILPGLLIGLLVMYVIPLVLFEGMELFSALSASIRIVWKAKLDFLKLGLILLAVNMAGVLALGIGLLFTIPLSYALIYFSFADLFDLHENKEEEEEDIQIDLKHFR